jgi:hypothetical protein
MAIFMGGGEVLRIVPLLAEERIPLRFALRNDKGQARLPAYQEATHLRASTQ